MSTLALPRHSTIRSPPPPHLGVAAQSGVSGPDQLRAGVTLVSPGLITPEVTPTALIRATHHTIVLTLGE